MHVHYPNTEGPINKPITLPPRWQYKKVDMDYFNLFKELFEASHFH